MAPTAEVDARILAAVKEKCPHFGPCTLCFGFDWGVSDGFAMVPLSNDAAIMPEKPLFTPLVMLVCKGCGDTRIFNLGALGLAELARPAGSVPQPPAN